MAAIVPFKNDIHAARKQLVHLSDIVPYRRHDLIFCLFLFFAKAEIYLLRMRLSLQNEIYPVREPHRGGSCGSSVKNITLIHRPEGKQRRKGISADDYFYGIIKAVFFFQLG